MESDGATLCMVALASGREPGWWLEVIKSKSAIKEEFHITENGEALGVRLDCGCPPLTQTQSSSGNFEPVDDCLVWWLPQEVSPAVLHLIGKIHSNQISTEDVGAAAESALHALKGRLNRTIQEGKLPRVLDQFLGGPIKNEAGDTPQMVDEAIIARIRGDSVTDYPQATYTIIEQSEIDKVGRAYFRELKRITGVTFSWPDVAPDPGYQNRRAGSQRVLKSSVVSTRFDDLYKLIHQFSRSPLDYTTAVAYYIYDAMALALAWRGVNDRVYDRSLFDLIAGTAFMDDKQIRGCASARVLPMAETTKSLLLFWNNLLKRLLQIYDGFSPAICGKIRSALDGTGPYIFAFSDDTPIVSGPEVEKLTLEYMKKTSYKNFDVPMNWGRHYLRNALISLGVRPDLIDAFLGHMHRYSQINHRYSCTDSNTYRRVSFETERVLQQVGVTADLPPLEF